MHWVHGWSNERHEQWSRRSVSHGSRRPSGPTCRTSLTAQGRVQVKAEAYGTFAEDPTRPEPERFFFPDDVDRDLIALRRTEHHRLGFALRMCTVLTVQE
ncbi:DUF4158 domain-containing protein [Streptomyces sp. NPDC089799]|uniref:DUF4158 domain-containing protein n=1 Tax=Streptomyces sp. NPDC089799 TaxID=3155066 RepID=UPI0034319039